MASSATAARSDDAPVSAVAAGSMSWIAILLGFLTAVGPVSTDIYLPAFPALEASLHAPAGSAEMTLAVWFVGLAVGQITMGPVSDRFGRRMPMLVGTLVYTLASVGCAVAPDIWTFSSFRLLASLGASASLVIPSACVRDLSHGNEAARLMSRLVLVMGVVPILAPTLGGFVLSFTTWRSIFWASAVYGLICTFLIARVLPETLAAHDRSVMPPVALAGRYLTLVRDRGFITNALVAGFGAFMSFTYLSAAPSVFIHLFGFSPAQFGMLFGVFAVCMIGASQLNGVLVGRIDATRILGISVGTAVLGTVAMTVVSIVMAFAMKGGVMLHSLALVPLVLTMMVALGTTGIIGPNATVGAMADHPRLAGSASAFVGTLQYVLGAVAGAIVGMLPATTPVPMSGVMLTGAVIMLLMVLLRPARRPGEATVPADLPMMH
ncbi:multidrug effflux MFS transporter [Gluconacetobacter diazotrophicus]|uniref:Bcr/CflA family efflux transporter n=1 Tax=Gluconacetobacter diazotrophicus (strain ATCC 49037 / DSM 5601 / CCUG 37298 / CIP 103539 / LMG 7603 / PAl5) TaxID=272568 RepID=A9HEV9_GLUDA|nr:multidrug effflux MFS transporter [Gluconacetobacter diazotrophicus]CAP55286.1 putative antibiotic resistance transport membrane protein [Gluconacetobacter diazotrophicus PA1 5]